MDFRSDMTVELIDHMGGDESILRAMLVSTGKDQVPVDLSAAGKINYLMQHRHGTPFEHNALTFRVEAPIFVFREWHRHRIGFSYNEYSGRYSEMKPIFHIPAPDRPIVPVPEPMKCGTCNELLDKRNHGLKVCGTCGRPYKYHCSARPYFAPLDDRNYNHLVLSFKTNYNLQWDSYQNLLKNNVAKEVAREILPVGIYSFCYVTCNARSLMAFLSLRTHDSTAKYVSYPQYEINDCANKVEKYFQQLFPLTHEAFNKNGRVGP